jgi:hypothetical protein
MVIIGVALEGPELVHGTISIIRRKFGRVDSAKQHHLPDWIALLGLFGWFLVVLGVAGEYVTDAMVSKADGNIQTFNDIMLTGARKDTALAFERAAHAETTARGFEAQIAESAARVKTAEAQVASANAASKDAVERIAAADARSSEASAKAESFRLEIAKANERAVLAQAQVAGATAEAAKANLELVKLKTPRSLSEEQQERIKSKIKPFSGIPFDLWVSTDSDSTALMEIIDAILSSAGWKIVPTEGTIQFANKAGVVTLSGISLHVPIEHLSEWGTPTIALRDALVVEGLATTVSADAANAIKDMKRDRIHVEIGSKPLN